MVGMPQRSWVCSPARSSPGKNETSGYRSWMKGSRTCVSQMVEHPEQQHQIELPDGVDVEVVDVEMLILNA
jgi:hypothetical protein